MNFIGYHINDFYRISSIPVSFTSPLGQQAQPDQKNKAETSYFWQKEVQRREIKQ